MFLRYYRLEVTSKCYGKVKEVTFLLAVVAFLGFLFSDVLSYVETILPTVPPRGGGRLLYFKQLWKLLKLGFRFVYALCFISFVSLFSIPGLDGRHLLFQVIKVFSSSCS